MELSKRSVESVGIILGLFEKASFEFNNLTTDEQEQIHRFHNENFSLNHCIRWGLQAATEVSNEVAPETVDTDALEVSEDLVEYLGENLEGIAESHLEAWKDRYHRKKLEDVVFDLRVNHDKDADIERIEEDLNRKLSDDERTYFYEAFIKEIEETFYL